MTDTIAGRPVRWLSLIPSEETKRPLITAAESDLPTDELIDVYLGGTPFADLLKVPIPFELPEQTRFEHHRILAQFTLDISERRLAFLEQRLCKCPATSASNVERLSSPRMSASAFEGGQLRTNPDIDSVQDPRDRPVLPKTARALDRVRRSGGGNHQACRREDALFVRQLHAGIDLGRNPKIVGRDNEVLQSATSRSRKNLKNSIPSRSRRFIISGLRTISPKIEAIFGASRK